MTDLEITKRCAEKIGIDIQLIAPETGFPGDEPHYRLISMCEGGADPYNPLHDDTQAMALVKKFPAACIDAMNDARWEAFNLNEPLDINRAICECVAQLP